MESHLEIVEVALGLLNFWERFAKFCFCLYYKGLQAIMRVNLQEDDLRI